MSYGASLTDAFRQVGTYVGRILRRARGRPTPPVVQSTKYKLVMDLDCAASSSQPKLHPSA